MRKNIFTFILFALFSMGLMSQENRRINIKENEKETKFFVYSGDYKFIKSFNSGSEAYKFVLNSDLKTIYVVRLMSDGKQIQCKIKK